MKLIRIKQKIALLCILLFGIFACVGMGVLALNETKANAQTILNDINSTLFLPESYEEYLPLKNPSSFAISSDYIVVADGCDLYIYDRLASKYSKYQHKSYPAGEAEKNISKVQIAEVEGEKNDRIFFSDIDNRLYEYEKIAPTVTSMIVDNVPVTTFVIDGKGEYLYVANATTEINSTSLKCYRLTDNQKLTATDACGDGQTVEGLSPLLTIDSENLYVCYGSAYVVPFELQTLKQCTSFFLDANEASIKDLQSICSFGGKMYYTVKDTGLFKVSGSSAIHLSLGGEDADRELSVLGVFGEELYCVKGSSIRKLGFDGEDNAFFADYEISSSSDSVGRLSGATDVVRAGSLVVVADTENHRVTVYDSAAGTYSVIGENDDFSPTLVATDGETIAAASNDKVYVCKYGEKQFSDTAVSNKGNIVGIACVYGSVYYVTQNDIQGRIGGGEPVTKSNGTPTALTSDLYGDLFVAYQDGNVKRFTEEEFLESGETGTTLDGITVPSNAKAMRADFKGNLYYLDESGALCCNGGKEPLATKIDATNFVYTDDKDKSPVSFALGYEDDEVYFLFGDFIVKTKAGALGFPTLDRIATQDVGEELGRTHTPEELARVNVSAGEIGIHVNLSYMKSDTPYFPYAGYSLFTRESEGVLLAETDDFRLVALYEDAAYRIYLLRKAGDPAEEEWTEGEGAMYLTSDVYVYYYPCVLLDHYPCEDESGAHGHEPVSAPVPAHSDAKLKRGTSVTVLGYTRSPDGEYALVSYENGNAREAATGYVPRSFLTDVIPYPDDEDEYWIGTLKPDAGVVFVANDGSATIVPEAGAQVRLYDNGDGTYTARYTDADGLSYSATVTSSMIDRGESDAWRIALIVILCVVAVGIVGAYVYLLPRSRKKIS